jgi:hypothetical protein
MKITKYLSFLFTLILLFSCADNKEEFIPTATSDAPPTGNPLVVRDSQICSGFTRIRPEVDFLFVWDNSSSFNFINDNTLASLRDTLSAVEERFDYRILLAPQIEPNPSNPTQFLISYTSEGLSNYAKSIRIPNDQGSLISVFDSIAQGSNGSVERGFERSLDLINNNIGHGIFREDAYLMVVFMSNGDDNSDIPPGGYRTQALEQAHFNAMKAGFLDIKSDLSNPQLRFISLVAWSTCQGSFIGERYRRMSRDLYQAQGFTDQPGRSFPDSYDICTANLRYLFQGPNSTIQDVIQEHVYDHWPVAALSGPVVEPDILQVKKSSGVVLSPNDPNGYQYIGYQENKNTRVLPSPGEPYTGLMIKLNGNGKVTYPDCLTIKTRNPLEFFNHIAVDQEPDLSTVIVTINGETISQSSSNGWQYVGYQTDLNVKVKSREEPNVPGVPALLQTGYMLKLNGSAIYDNSSNVRVQYRRKI